MGNFRQGQRDAEPSERQIGNKNGSGGNRVTPAFWRNERRIASNFKFALFHPAPMREDDFLLANRLHMPESAQAGGPHAVGAIPQTAKYRGGNEAVAAGATSKTIRGFSERDRGSGPRASIGTRTGANRHARTEGTLPFPAAKQVTWSTAFAARQIRMGLRGTGTLRRAQDDG